MRPNNFYLFLITIISMALISGTSYSGQECGTSKDCAEGESCEIIDLISKEPNQAATHWAYPEPNSNPRECVLLTKKNARNIKVLPQELILKAITQRCSKGDLRVTFDHGEILGNLVATSNGGRKDAPYQVSVIESAGTDSCGRSFYFVPHLGNMGLPLSITELRNFKQGENCDDDPPIAKFIAYTDGSEGTCIASLP